MKKNTGAAYPPQIGESPTDARSISPKKIRSIRNGEPISPSNRDEELESLRESEERLRMAVEITQTGTWDYDPQTKELQWSPECKALYGLPDNVKVTGEL